MHPLLARLAGRPALKNLDVEIEAVDRKLAKLRLAGEAAQNYATSIDAAQKAWLDSPTLDRCKAWITAEAGRQAAFAVTQTIRDLILTHQATLLGGLGPVIRAAIDEMLPGIAEQKAKIVADDAARSLEFDEEVHSVAALALLDRKTAALEDARGWADHDPSRAIQAIRTVLG